MSNISISQLAAAIALSSADLIEVSQLSSTVKITATTISALASDNSYNDSGSGFIIAGFAVGDRVNVAGFTVGGTTVDNITVGVITALTAGKMTIGGTDGDVIVDATAGPSVTIAKWLSKASTIALLASLASSEFNPNTNPIIANAADDEFASGSSINLSKWTALNLGGLVTNSVGQGALTAKFAYVTGSVALRGWTQPWSGGAGSYRCKMIHNTSTSGGPGSGIIMGRAGKYVLAAFIYASQFFSGFVKMTSTSVLSSSGYITNGTSPNYQSVISVPSSMNYFEALYDGTNIKLSMSPDGYDNTFASVLTETAATFLGGAPDTVGFGFVSDITGRASSTINAVVPWFRKYT